MRKSNRPPEPGARGLLRLTCPCCGLVAKGKTNIMEPEITIPCKCGNPITLHWNKDTRRYTE